MVSRVEKELLVCNEDKFANVCRLYLAYKYGIVNSSGSALGVEKSKPGVPDNFIFYRGYYIFNEITTQQKGLKAKLKKDINDCFSQKVISSDRIAKIILMCNSKVSPKVDKELRDYKDGIDSSTELEIIGIDAFANIIVNEYPTLCREIGIPIDTGQIVEVEQFVSLSEKSKFSTTLKNQFFNRTEEVKLGQQYLEENNFLLITGQAGIGKTKLSLKLVEIFKSKHPDYIVKYLVNNNNLDIWEDLKSQITSDKKYLLVVDDANKLKNNLGLILSFVNRREDGGVKVILTVRNYVKKHVEEYLDSFNIIEVKEFTREELSKILKSPEYNISQNYIDKIYSISKGNPRIALMAAIAGLKKELDKINNASQIHEQYFTNIRSTITSLNDVDLLKVAGILSLLKNIDTHHVESLDEIEIYFSIPKKVLLDKLKILFEIEVADELDGIFKIADQILGEYIFYLVFIKDNILPFKSLLLAHTEKRKFSLPLILNPIITNYGFNFIKDIIGADIQNFWNEVKLDNSKNIQYLRDFWYYLFNETLLFLTERLKDQLQLPLEDFKFEIYDENYIERYDDDIISLLINFKEKPELFSFGLELLFKYGLSSQINFSKTLKALKQSFTFGQYSYQRDYNSEIQLFEFLFKKSEESYVFFAKIILFISDKYLIDSYNYDRSEGNTMLIIPQALQPTENQIEFRTKLWQFIFNCYKSDKLKDDVLDFFLRHNYSYQFSIDEMIKFDTDLIQPFIESNFTNSNFKESLVVERFIKRLKRLGVDCPDDYEIRFYSNEYKTWILLNERGELNKKLIIDSYKDFSLADYKTLLEELDIIKQHQPNYFSGWSTILESITYIFEDLANRNVNLFLDVFEMILKSNLGNNIRLGKAFSTIHYNEDNVSKFRNLIVTNKENHAYLVTFYLNLPSEQITVEDYNLVIELLRTDKLNYIAFFEDLLPKVDHLNLDLEKEIKMIFDILLERSKSENRIFIHPDFFKYIHNQHNKIFYSNIDTIKQIYLALDKQDRYFDYELTLLKLILDKQPIFIKELLTVNFGDLKSINKRDIEDNDYTKLWELTNYEIVFKRMFDFFANYPKFFANSPIEMASVFKGGNVKELNFLNKVLVDETNEGRLIRLFNIVVSKYENEKFNFLKIILYKNQDIEFFKKLDLYTQSMTYSGSVIPRIHQEIDFYEKTKEFIVNLKDIRFIEHINFLNRCIMGGKISIDRARKREFIDRWGV